MAVALLTVVVQIWSLARELFHATGAVKRKKKKKERTKRMTRVTSLGPVVLGIWWNKGVISDWRQSWAQAGR